MSDNTDSGPPDPGHIAGEAFALFISLFAFGVLGMLLALVFSKIFGQ